MREGGGGLKKTVGPVGEGEQTKQWSKQALLCPFLALSTATV